MIFDFCNGCRLYDKDSNEKIHATISINNEILCRWYCVSDTPENDSNICCKDCSKMCKRRSAPYNIDDKEEAIKQIKAYHMIKKLEGKS